MVWLPFVEGHLRSQKMKVLGGRSPMEVVTGITPTLPATLRAGLLVENLSTDSYTENLIAYLKETHRRVRAVAKELEIEQEGRNTGSPGGKALVTGDLVALKRGNAPKGVARFGWSTDGQIYRIKSVLGENTYALETLTTGKEPVGYGVANRFSADRLVKLDLPEQPLTNGSPQKVEIFDEEAAEWSLATVEKWAVDGRTFIRFDDASGRAMWIDLTRCRYRWVLDTRQSAAEGQGALGEA